MSHLSLVPVLILLIVYFVVRRRPGGTRILLICGAVIFLVMETLLPVSPFKTTVTSALQKRAMEAVEIKVSGNSYFTAPRWACSGTTVYQHVVSSPIGAVTP